MTLPQSGLLKTSHESQEFVLGPEKMRSPTLRDRTCPLQQAERSSCEGLFNGDKGGGG